VRIESGITATPNPKSAFWFDQSTTLDWMPEAYPAALVPSPTEVLAAYLRSGVRETSINVVIGTRVAPAEMSTAKAINKAHEDSGLTWEQLARMFGVSRRSVHMWATGGRMNATNAEMLMRFVDLLDSMQCELDERRAALLAIGGDGASAIDNFRRRHTNIDKRFDSIPKPGTLLGALHGDADRRH
jgi:hypothetical protein